VTKKLTKRKTKKINKKPKTQLESIKEELSRENIVMNP